MAGGQRRLTPSAWLRAARSFLVSPPGPWSHGGHVTWNILSQCLLIPHSVEDLGTLGGIWYSSRSERELENRRWVEGKRG